ncbi:MAG: zf-TFIIB domain-containing protein [Myxococcota bacterium]
MECPACPQSLTEVKLQDVTVDVCQEGCGGIWFDNYELQKVDEAHEHQGESLLAMPGSDPVPVDHEERRHCPRCLDFVMMRHFFSVKQKVEIDRCPQCNGVWLDLGELLQIRKAFAREEDRHREATKHFDQLFRKELASMRNKSQQDLERSRQFARMFRFICPSHYIPGDQDWGAF